MPGIEQRFHSRDRRLASLTHAARRIGAQLNQITTKFMAPPPWVPSVEESEQLAELQRILAAKPQQFDDDFILGSAER
jgi:hypothetical protein